MTSQCLSIAQTVSSKLCARKARVNSSSISAKNVLPFPIIHRSSSSPSFCLYLPNSIRNTFKPRTRAKKIGPEREEKEETEDDDEEDFQKENEDGEDTSEEDDDSEDIREEDDDKKGIREGDDDKEDFGAEETVLKLYTDIKNRNIDGISEVIGDECQCFSNFFSTYRLLRGKKQVMAFFYWLIKNLGKDIKIIVKPTSKDGMTVGVQWQLG